MPGRTIDRGLKALKLVSLLFPVAASMIWGTVSYHAAEQSATTHVQLQARILSQHLERVIEAQQVLHRAVVSQLEVGSEGYVAGKPLHLFLKDIAEAQPSLNALQLVDAKDRVIADSLSYPVRSASGTMDYAAAFADGAKLWVSRDVGPGHDCFLVVTPVAVSGFTGAVVSKLDTGTVQAFLRRLAAREGEAASVGRSDGTLLVRNFDAEPTHLPPDAPGRSIPLSAQSGTFQTVAVTDGIRRIYGFDWADDMPVYANFGVPTSLVWWDWGKQFAPLLALFSLMGLFMWATAERISRGIHLRSAQEESLKRAETAERLAAQRINLMREMNHRVKNNLALVVSLINLQSRGGKGVDAEALKTRIGAISHVHDLMHQAADAVHVDFATMLDDIAASPAIVPRESGITVETALERGIMLEPDRITPLSVIAAELMTNAVKHAFRGRTGGTIKLRLFRDTGIVVLMVSDDGVGMDASSNRHSGNAIIEALVAQIDGHLVRETENGLTTILRFPV